ncbi:MAG TPA: 2TM domain-containing protein [Ignavibacteria bacterium]|jgi:hypothetical protein
MENTEQQIDEKLWKIAKRRAEFKRHLLIYIVINIFLWSIWLVTGLMRGHLSYPWPAWVTFGWGIGVLFNYIGAYTGFKDSLTEKEYQKLVNKQTGNIS